MSSTHSYARTLAIDPSRKGFGFVVLEGPRRLLDWGAARVWATNDKEFLARVEGLVDRYSPALIVAEEATVASRSGRAIRRIAALAKYANTSNLELRLVSRADVQRAFREAGSTKREIALGIAGLFPDLAPHLPPLRRPWMSEDERMNIFDAMGLALTAIWQEVH